MTTSHLRGRVLLSVATVLLLIASIAAAPRAHAETGTTVPGQILRTDTTWTLAQSPVTITGTVQIASTATLTIDPGVQVLVRTPQQVPFLVAGRVVAVGTAQQRVRFDAGGYTLFSITTAAGSGVTIRYATITNEESIVGNSANPGAGALQLSDSIVVGGAQFGSTPNMISYPTEDVRIERNVFVKAGGFNVYFDHRNGGPRVYFLNNRFATASATGAWIASQASYGDAVQVHGNAFEVAAERTLFLAPGAQSAAIDATSNYWSTTDTTTIDSMIYDQNDDVNVTGEVPYEPILTAPDSDTAAWVPTEPRNVSASRGDTTAHVSWAAPTNDRGAAVDGYQVTPHDLTTATTGTVTLVGASARSIDVADLTNGDSYIFDVAAHNSVGDGDLATSDPITPAGPPAAPSQVTAIPADSALTVTWAAASPNGAPVSSYRVSANPGGASCTSTTDTTCVIAGLTNGQAYDVTVKATNDVGEGAASTPLAATPYTTPGALLRSVAYPVPRACSFPGMRQPTAARRSPVTGQPRQQGRRVPRSR